MGDAASAVAFLERAATAASPDEAAEAALRSDATAEILSLGDRARDERRFADAVDAYKAYLRLQPGEANIWIQLGHCQKESDRPDDAEQAYLRSLELDPDNAVALLHLGLLKLSAGDLASAASCLERATTTPFPSEEAREKLRALWLDRAAEAAAGSGDEDDVLGEIIARARSFGFGKEAAEFWTRLADLLKTNAGEAERALLQAIEVDPENLETLLRLVRIELEVEDPASAARYLRQAVAALPAGDDAAGVSQGLRTNAADLAMTIGDRGRDGQRWWDAIEAYRTALRFRPDLAKVWHSIGRCLEAAGKPAEAEKAYLRSLEIEPDTAKASPTNDRSLGEDIRQVRSEARLIRDASEAHSAALAALVQRIDAIESEVRAVSGLVRDTIRTRLEQIVKKLDTASNEAEFIRRRVTTSLTAGEALAYLADQTPILLDPSDPGVAGAILNGGQYETENLDVLFSFVRPDTVFVDLGANVGVFSLLIAKRVRSSGAVYAFEPQKHLASLLRRSAFMNGLGSLEGDGIIRTFEVGASDKNGTVGFVIPGEHLGGGRVIPDAHAPHRISVVRLDDFLGDGFCCDLVKIDVEGHELQALRGMQKILSNSRHVKVLFENHSVSETTGAAIEDFFEGLRFRLFEISANATLIALRPGDLVGSQGYALAARIDDPDLDNPDRRRIFIYPAQMTLGTASFDNGALRSTARTGQIVFHGPYWFLSRGQYRIVLHGELEGSLQMTIGTRFGYPMTTIWFCDGAAEAQFTIERDAVLFECVARSAGDDMALTLQKIEIVRR